MSAMDLHQELAGIVETLERGQVPYALCGGLAVAFHGYARFTKDIDLLVLSEHVETVKRLVVGQGFVLEAEPMTFGAGGPAERVVHRISKVVGGELLTLDLLVLPASLADIWRDREVFQWEGRRITVVSAAGLARMKRVAGRRQDLLDLEQLGYPSSGGDDDG
jgi:hypothetical protein